MKILNNDINEKNSEIKKTKIEKVKLNERWKI